MATLGLCDGHDAGVCLVDEGRVLFALSEERVSGRKGAPGFPELSLARCLKDTGATARDLRAVAYADDSGRAPTRLLDSWYREAAQGPGPASLSSRLMMAYQNAAASAPGLGGADRRLGRAALKRRLDAFGLGAVPLKAAPHHLAHLASAAFTSGWDRALVLSLDGYGEGLCGMAASMEKGRLNVLARFPALDSVGLLYGIVTQVLGFEEGEEGKTMGLAAYGDPSAAREMFDGILTVERGRPRLSRAVWGAAFRKKLERIGREDAAAALQAATEDAVCGIAAHWAREAGADRAALAGGVFANVRATQVLKKRTGLIPYVFPHMGDGGLCVGAALLAERGMGAAMAASAPLEAADLGPDLAPGEVDEAVREAGDRLQVERPADVSEAAADALAAGKIVAWARGRGEFGPRALGRRSVLAPAHDPAVARRLGEALGRPGFMPFGPAVRREDASALFSDLQGTERSLPFMTVCVDLAPGAEAECRGAAHLDGTARPQTVDARSHPEWHRLLGRYAEKTGKRCLINTSFNLHGEPIALEAKRAVSTFLRSGLDLMILGGVAATPGRRHGKG